MILVAIVIQPHTQLLLKINSIVELSITYKNSYTTCSYESMNTYIFYLWLQLYCINEFNLCTICLWLAVIGTVKSEIYIRICLWVLFDPSFVGTLEYNSTTPYILIES